MRGLLPTKFVLPISLAILVAVASPIATQEVAPPSAPTGQEQVGALDGQPITGDEFAIFLARKYRTHPTGTNLLGDLRDRTLIELAATRLGVTVRESAVDREYRSLAERVESETKGKQTLQDYLVQKGTTIGEFKTYLRRLVAAREVIRAESKLPADAPVSDAAVGKWLVAQAKRVGVTTDASLPADIYLRVGDRQFGETEFGRELMVGLAIADRAKELDRMLKIRLIDRELAANALEVTDVDLDRAIAAERERYATSPRTKGIPYDQILKQLGTSIPEKKANLQFRGNLGILKIAEARFDDVALRRYFDANQNRFGESVRVRHIVVRVKDPAQPFRGGRTDDEAKKRAERLRTRIVEGEPFEKVARADSEDRTRLQGGNLGFIHREGKLDPAFATAAFALEPGRVSEPVRTKFGYHLIEVVERRPAPEFASMRERVLKARAQDWFRDAVKGAKMENRYLAAVMARARKNTEKRPPKQ